MVALADAEEEFQRRFVRCPERNGEDHEWVSFTVDESKPCRFCGRGGRENFAAATKARSELFAGLRAPDSAHGRVKK